jgi:hypothetical protein
LNRVARGGASFAPPSASAWQGSHAGARIHRLQHHLPDHLLPDHLLPDHRDRSPATDHLRPITGDPITGNPITGDPAAMSSRFPASKVQPG